MLQLAYFGLNSLQNLLMADKKPRLGVDIGGTFTDLVLELGDTRYSAKVLTTHQAPENAIIQGLHQVCGKASIHPGDIGQVIHGTTLATNALIERRGAKTALITTEGFRDVIEMRTESRFEQYDLNLTLPEPLLPRQMRYTVEERLSAKGDVLMALARSEVEQLADQIVEAGYESVAVGLLHSYLNPAHETLIREVLLEKQPCLSVSLSSEVSPQMREYERFNTVVANAYIKPLMASYLTRLEARLGEEGIQCAIFLMHSGGGIISVDNAARFPVRLVESGPAGGAVFAANMATRYGLGKVLSFDMGGTTAKICLIKDQTPKTSRVFEVARSYRFKKGSGMPISIPVIDMVEIGAGGGSLAHIDSMRQIKVGPESAGSEPGPACYNRGGKQPAVTDADLVLGKLDPDNFAAGSITLDTHKSNTALEQYIGETLGMHATDAAYGVAEVVDENMANAARVHAVENGEDIKSYTMIAFGGAAPLHAARLCEKLGIERMLVPTGAGVGSAIGFLRAPFSFEANRSVYMTLSQFNAANIKQLLAELAVEAEGFVRSCDTSAEIHKEYKVYMRYSGQGWEIPVVLKQQDVLEPRAEAYHALFEADYTKYFGRPVDGMDIEITVWAVNATTHVESAKAVEALASEHRPTATTHRSLFDPVSGQYLNAGVFQRTQLTVGATIVGPAVIPEDETSVIVPAQASARVHVDGCIDVTLNSAGGSNE